MKFKLFVTFIKMYFVPILFQDSQTRLGYANLTHQNLHYFKFLKKNSYKEAIRDYVNAWLGDTFKIVTIMDTQVIFEDIEYFYIVDEKEKVYKNNGEVGNFEGPYSQFMTENNIWDGTDYMEDEIDYRPQRECICVYEECKCGKSCTCTFNTDNMKCTCGKGCVCDGECTCGKTGYCECPCTCGFDEDKVVEVENEVIFTGKFEGEGVAVPDDYIRRRFGEEYLEKSYVQGKVEDAKRKIDFFATVCGTVDEKKEKEKYVYYLKKKLTQMCRLYKYEHHNEVPYNFVVKSVKKSVTSTDDTNTYLETHVIKLENQHCWGNIKYTHTFDIYDDGYDYETYMKDKNCVTKCEGLKYLYIPSGNMERLLDILHEDIWWKII